LRKEKGSLETLGLAALTYCSVADFTFESDWCLSEVRSCLASSQPRRLHFELDLFVKNTSRELTWINRTPTDPMLNHNATFR
jgi:hypothetical protein